jgi:NAD(P)-dependent dehydrogenase (short-subunit alcohol dehydrogenase family)
MMDLGISGKRVLVTGASKGIGAAIARAFAREGCVLSLLARNEKNLNQVLDEIGGAKAGHDYLSVNLRETKAPTQAVNELLARHKYFDIVVHNVGGALGRKGPLTGIDHWKDVWDFNAGIPIEINRLLIPLMKKQQWGRVIHISSISAEAGEPREHPYGGALPYAAAKAYLNAYVKGLGIEMAEHNIIVTALMPGAVLSKGKYWEKLSKTKPELVKEFLNRHYSIGRFATADEIAPFAVFMASEQASFAAGSIVPLGGGRM